VTAAARAALGEAPHVDAALRAGRAFLEAQGIDGAARDARRLMAHVLGLSPDRVTLHLADPLGAEPRAGFADLLARRAAREPVAQITGRREFWGRSFRVTRATLDPRPETETLVEQALAAPFARILDLGTGTGCILLSCLAERRMAQGVGVDLSPEALAVARANASDLGLTARVDLRCSDWFAAVEGRFDLIVSNPPYIAADEMAALAPEVRDWEPHLALSPGGDGLAAYRAILSGVGPHLAPGGRLLLEIGWQQGAAVAALAQAAGLRDVRVLPDLDGRDRVVAAQAPG